jgi:hypothetical protein
MTTASDRAKHAKQPRGGYLQPKTLASVALGSGEEELEATSFSSSLTGMAVDYLTRFMLGDEAEDAFAIPLRGASNHQIKTHEPTLKVARGLCNKVTGLDDASIRAASKLAGFDVCFRKSDWQNCYVPIENIEPDLAAVNNIRIMVERGLAFFKEYGPVVKDNFGFEGGYSNLVTIGEGDYLTKDAIWDFKVSKKLSKEQTLQILMYYIMGKHSGKKEFKNISKIGIFNPRLNIAYQISVDKISPEIIKAVETEVICY